MFPRPSTSPLFVRALLICLLLNFVALQHSLVQAFGPIVLYDGGRDTLPSTQNWLAFAGTGATESVVNGRTRLVTNQQFPAGYSNYNATNPPTFVNPVFPQLDRSIGYTIRFDLQMNSERHSNPDRSGFSISTISSDGRMGIELGFWEDQIWAQEGGRLELFTKDEMVRYDTRPFTLYELVVKGNKYALRANGMQIMSGMLRNYTAFVPPVGFPNPYELPNFLALSDNTSSAQADIELAFVSVTVDTPNTAPVITIPSSQQTQPDTNLSITGLSVTDADVGAEVLQVTLICRDGLLTIGPPDELIFTIGDGVSDSNITFTGTLTTINRALQDFVYRSAVPFRGTDTIVVEIDDLGHRGMGGAKTARATIPVVVLGHDTPLQPRTINYLPFVFSER